MKIIQGEFLVHGSLKNASCFEMHTLFSTSAHGKKKIDMICDLLGVIHWKGNLNVHVELILPGLLSRAIIWDLVFCPQTRR